MLNDFFLNEENGWVENICKVFILLGALVSFWMPFVVDDTCFFPFVGPKSIIFMAAAEVIFFSWVILAMVNPKYRADKNVIFWAIIGFIISSGISTFMGVDPSRSFWSKYERMTGFLMQIHTMFYFVGLASTFRNKKDWLVLLSCSSFLALNMAFTFLSYKFNPAVAAQYANSQGGLTLGNKSFMGTYLMFNAFFALYLFLTAWFSWENIFPGKESQKSSWRNILLYFSALTFVLIGVVMKLANTRAMFFSYLGGIALFACLMIYYRWEHGKKFGKFILGAFALFCVLFLISIFWANSPLNTLLFNVNKAFIASGGGARLLIWKNIWPQVLQKPLFGWGPENFELSFYKTFDSRLFLPDWGQEIWFDRAHNVFVDYLVSHGFIGTLLYLSIFGTAGWLLYKRFRRDEKEFWVFVTMVPLLSAYLVQNITVFDMVSSLMVLFLTLAFIVGQSLSDEKNTDVKKSDNPWQVVLMVVSILAFLSCFNVFILRAYQGAQGVIDMIVSYDGYGSKDPNMMKKLDNVYGKGYVYKLKFAQADVDARTKYYDEVVETANIGKYQIRDFLTETFLKHVSGIDKKLLDERVKDEKTKNEIIKGIVQEYEFWINKAKESVTESPYDYRANLKLGALIGSYAMKFDPARGSEADAIFQKAEKMGGNNPNTYWYWAQLYIDLGDVKTASKIAQKAADVAPEVPQVYNTIVQIAKINNDKKTISEWSQRAITQYEKQKAISLNSKYWDEQIAIMQANLR